MIHANGLDTNRWYHPWKLRENRICPLAFQSEHTHNDTSFRFTQRFLGICGLVRSYLLSRCLGLAALAGHLRFKMRTLLATAFLGRFLGNFAATRLTALCCSAFFFLANGLNRFLSWSILQDGVFWWRYLVFLGPRQTLGR